MPAPPPDLLGFPIAGLCRVEHDSSVIAHAADDLLGIAQLSRAHDQQFLPSSCHGDVNGSTLGEIG